MIFGGRRAFGLASTLAVVSLLLVLGFTLSGLAFAHLNTARADSNRQAAQNLAESSLALTVERLMARLADPAEGINTKFGTENEVISTGGEEDGFGRVTFDRGQTDFPYSTNNLAGKEGKFGYGGTLVAPGCLHLVGTGRTHGVTRHVEAVLRIPTFPYAITSAGDFTCSRGLRVSSLSPGSVPLANEAELPPAEERHPGDMLCNGAVTLGPDCEVSGVLRHLGALTAPTAVLGGTEQLTAPRPILDIDLSKYAPGASTSTGTQLTAPVDGTVSYAPASGTLTVPGDLEFVDPASLLFVQGHLDVQGAIRGKGVIVATGGVKVAAGVTLQGSHEVALLAGGDVELNGGLGAFFQGLVYTKGSFAANNIAIVGALVTNGGPSAAVKLDNVAMYADPDYVFNTSLEVTGTVTTDSFGSYMGERHGQVRNEGDGETNEWDPGDARVRNKGERHPQAQVTFVGKLDAAAVARLYNHKGQLDLGKGNLDGNYSRMGSQLLQWSFRLQKLAPEPDANGNPVPVGEPLTFTTLEEAKKALHEMVGRRMVLVGYPPNQHWAEAGAVAARNLEKSLNSINSAGRVKDVLPPKGPPTSGSAPRIIDTRQFLNPQDRIRVVMWRPLE